MTEQQLPQGCVDRLEERFEVPQRFFGQRRRDRSPVVQKHSNWAIVVEFGSGRAPDALYDPVITAFCGQIKRCVECRVV